MSNFWPALNEHVIGIKLHIGSQYEWFGAAVLVAFTLMNSVRILAYVPQILVAAKDGNGASAISYTTWTLFLASHLTTIVYAVVCLGDLTTALVFLGNAMACVAIILTTFIKRRQHAARQTSDVRRAQEWQTPEMSMRSEFGAARGLIGK